jgi:hypothetical protein
MYTLHVRRVNTLRAVGATVAVELPLLIDFSAHEDTGTRSEFGRQRGAF